MILKRRRLWRHLVQQWSSQHFTYNLLSRFIRMHFRISLSKDIIECTWHDARLLLLSWHEKNQLPVNPHNSFILSKRLPQTWEHAGQLLADVGWWRVFITQVWSSQHWLRPVTTTNWFLFSEADDVSCFVGPSVVTTQVLMWRVARCQRFIFLLLLPFFFF